MLDRKKLAQMMHVEEWDDLIMNKTTFPARILFTNLKVNWEIIDLNYNVNIGFPNLFTYVIILSIFSIAACTCCERSALTKEWSSYQ